MSQYHGRGGPGEIATTPGASINYVDDERSAGVALPPASKSAARVYSTALGMHKRLTLPDGSRAHLNSASSISVSISPSSRSIELIAGEALFEVNHESARPFRVKSGRSVIEDIGTAFDVYKKPHSTRVLVVDGRIKISRIATGSRSGPNDSRVHEGNIESNALSAEFHKGQQIELPDDSDGSAYTRSNLLDAELSRLTAWREGRIEYQGEPLEQAVEEFGRYHTERFILADEALRKLKIGGSISTSNVDQFLLMLRLEFDIRSDRSLEADGSTTITLTSGSPKRHRTIARDETEDP
ncbi:MAG: FecR family protein [Steroidobacteraceae bacterium]